MSNFKCDSFAIKLFYYIIQVADIYYKKEDCIHFVHINMYIANQFKTAHIKSESYKHSYAHNMCIYVQ